jgi:ankyrin repeat protein
MDTTDSILTNVSTTILHQNISASIAPANYKCDVFELVCNGTAEEIENALRIQGINVDIQNDKGDTLLIVAARRGEESVVKTLLTCGARLDIRNFKGSNSLIAAAMKGHAHICSLLLACGADVNQGSNHI